ncbi:nuclear pore complex protein GP210 isoform X2 [Capsella rubella]|uniref:nuclear pore complex protein GP210 isoform X2 n=1 Tax=Capsella rubella TaxID=81985 RepID=UPI000CD58B58|nr:nuclear pore complex protein GP210 isoform X2 [Capsella rubella]
MVRFSLCLFFLLLLLSAGEISSQLGSGPRILDLKTLIPPKMKNPVGFKWSWDHHDSHRACVKSIASYSGRKETAFYATDIQTRIMICCTVFFGIFSRIKLDLNGLSMLRVRAFDNEENEFRSLVGLQLIWKLMPGSGGSTQHLAHVPLKESPLTDCGGFCAHLDIQKKLEDGGVFSDLFVVKGTGIGHEKVSVHLLDAPLTHITDEIVVAVAEVMSLELFSAVYVLVGASFGYTLNVIRGNVPQAVHLPSLHHRWSVLNSSVAQVGSLIDLTKALSLWKTTVILEDTRVAGHFQTPSINVVTPDTFILQLVSALRVIPEFNLVFSNPNTKVSVGAYICPQNPVIHTGTLLNFSIVGVDHQVSGKRVTSNRSNLSVNVALTSGQAKTISQGSAHGHRLKMQTKLTLLLGNTIFVGSPRETITNVHAPAEGYDFPVKFRENRFVVSENGNKATFNCQVDPSFIGYAKPWTDIDSGSTFCLFFPYSPKYLVHSMSIAEYMKPYVSFSVIASLNEAHQVSGSASALLIGGFSVKGPSKLYINPDSNTNIILILGNTDVQIDWDNKGKLSISLIKREDYGIAGYAMYKVNVLTSKQFTERICITLPATGETLVASSKDRYSDLFEILWVVLGSSLYVIILIKVIKKLRPNDPTKASRTATNDGATAAGTPYRRGGVVTYHVESPKLNLMGMRVK